jgi:hypothetical protein
MLISLGSILRCLRRGSLLVGLMVPAILGLAACGHRGESNDEARVRQTFESWQAAILDSHMNQAMTYIPRNVYDYFQMLNLGGKAVPSPATPAGSVAAEAPGVDMLIRAALDRKVTPGVRPTLTLDDLVQRIADKRLFKPRDLREIKLGYIAVNGAHASADIYYQGTLTALRLPFLRQGDEWKIDVLAILPYVEVLMRVDRAIKGESETQQVDRLVSNMPLL